MPDNYKPVAEDCVDAREGSANRAAMGLEAIQGDSGGWSLRRCWRLGQILMLVAALLLMPTAARAQDEEKSFTLTHGLLIGSFLLHGIDLGGSMYRFGRDGDNFRETNPLLGPLRSNPATFAVAKMGIATGINWLLYHESEKSTKHRDMVKWTLAAQDALMLFVVVKNARQP
jgi:hypothetical protein